MVVVLFMGAIQLLSLGIMGEYMRRIFIESKGRPTYVVARIQGRPLASQDDAAFSVGIPGTVPSGPHSRQQSAAQERITGGSSNLSPSTYAVDEEA